jgi:hypothetical protein
VHGLGSNPDTTWGPKGSNWVSDFLPHDIPAALHKDIRVFFYNYDSYWKRDAVQTRLWRLGRGLVDGLCSQIWRTDEVGVRAAPSWSRLLTLMLPRSERAVSSSLATATGALLLSGYGTLNYAEKTSCFILARHCSALLGARTASANCNRHLSWLARTQPSLTSLNTQAELSS